MINGRDDETKQRECETANSKALETEREGRKTMHNDTVARVERE